jgi:rod shape-determining protein MreD
MTLRNLVAFPILILSVVLQSAVVSRVTLLAGFADLPLVLVIAWAIQDGVASAWHWAVLAGILTAFVSGLPWLVPLAGFLAAVFLARVLQRRIWQAPLLAMFSVTFLASLLFHVFSYIVLSIFRSPLPFGDSFSLVTLPSVLLNMLLAIPVFWLMRDLARWVYPVEEAE